MSKQAEKKVEIWDHVKGYEEHYMISTYGQVKSLKLGCERILKLQKRRNGYLQVDLRLSGQKKKTSLVDRLVAKAFLEDWDENMTVNHKNFDRADNRVENLEMMSHSKN